MSRLNSAVLVVLLGLGLALGCAPARAGEDPAYDAMVEAERAFARRANEIGVTAAFVEFLADDAIVFRPNPVAAKPWYAAQPKAGFALDWRPAQAEIAASGDLGYTLGPWLLRPIGKPDADPAAGHFFSIWQRGDDGRFRNVLDLGVEHGPQALAAAVDRRGPKRFGAEPLAPAAAKAREQALLRADRALVAELSTPDAHAALRAALTEDAIVLRTGSGPRQGPGGVAPFAPLAWCDLAMLRMSAAGDFGATAGWGGDPKKPFSYARAWRWTDRGWKVAADILSP